MNRLLVVAPSWLGDAVMALPAIADVRRAVAGARLEVAARPGVASLFRMIEGVDRVIGREAGAFTAGIAPSAEADPDPGFDAALLLPNSFRSALDVARSRVRERWGYSADARAWLLTRAVPRPPADTHQVDSYQYLVRALGFANGDSTPAITVPPDTRAAAAQLLEEAGWTGAPLVAVAPGAAFGGAKRWPPASFADLIRRLTARGIAAVLVGSAADAGPARAVEAALGPDRQSVLTVVGRTDVPALAGVLSHARALVANDSGAMHLGAAIGLPVAAVFGPTDERLTTPRSRAASVVLTNPVWCRPCMLRECPLDHQCMRGIPAETVAAAVDRLMS